VNDYEGLFIIKNDKEENIEKVTEQITKNITGGKGKITKTEKWGKKHLSYPIKKQKEAVYIKLNFSVDPSEITKLDRAYKLNNGILRTLIIKR